MSDAQKAALSPEVVLEQMKKNGVTHVVWLPDSETNWLYLLMKAEPSLTLVGVNREALAFSYPHGAFDERLEGMVRGAGFKLAVTDLGGLNRTGTDPLRIRRTMVTSRDVAPTYLFKAATGWGLMGWLSR